MAEKEVEQLLEIVSERDCLKDRVESLQHALSDVQSATGAADVREVLRRYQTQEVKSEQMQEQLRSRVEQLQAQVSELQDTVASLTFANQVSDPCSARCNRAEYRVSMCW
jgi:predicted RNase H-like nuclease (RuvC/YqgF family)